MWTTPIVYLFPLGFLLLASWGFTWWVNRLLRIYGGKVVGRWSKGSYLFLGLVCFLGGVLVFDVFRWISSLIAVSIDSGFMLRGPTGVIPLEEYGPGWIGMFAVLHLIWAVWQLEKVHCEEFIGYWVAVFLIEIVVLLAGSFMLMFGMFFSILFLQIAVIAVIPTVIVQMKRRHKR